jgi:hypothetical protein
LFFWGKAGFDTAYYVYYIIISILLVYIIQFAFLKGMTNVWIPVFAGITEENFKIEMI